MSADKEEGWNDYLVIILNQYKDECDDCVLSVGDWDREHEGVPDFRACMQMRLGDLRKFALTAR